MSTFPPQRAEASLATHFPELRRLGANSSGLDSVSGAAHTTLAIMLLRQCVAVTVRYCRYCPCSGSA